MSYVFGKYEIESKIAGGGMAEIYKAVLHGVEGFEKDVALKMIHPHLIVEQEFIDMFIREATLAAKLDHPNIVRIYEFNEHSGIYYISMEYIKGVDLKYASKQKNGPWSPETVFFIGGKILSALDYAHSLSDENGSLNIIHRDVSPQNILLSVNGEIKLADFGIAKVRDAVSYTNTNTVRGKLHYLSPEQARGEVLDSRSDIFSLGIVLWETLTGTRYYGRENRDVYHEAMAGTYRPPSSVNSGISSTVDELMHSFLAPDKNDRFLNAKEALKEIRSIFNKDESSYFEENITKLFLEKEREKNSLYDMETDLLVTSLISGQIDNNTSELPTRLFHDPKIQTKEITFLHNEVVRAKEGIIPYNNTETMTLPHNKTFLENKISNKKTVLIFTFFAGLISAAFTYFILTGQRDKPVNPAKHTSSSAETEQITKTNIKNDLNNLKSRKKKQTKQFIKIRKINPNEKSPAKQSIKHETIHKTQPEIHSKTIQKKVISITGGKFKKVKTRTSKSENSINRKKVFVKTRKKSSVFSKPKKKTATDGELKTIDDWE